MIRRRRTPVRPHFQQDMTTHYLATHVRARARMVLPALRTVRESNFDVLLQTIVQPYGTTREGELIEVVALPWLEIFGKIESDPDYLFQFTKHSRKFEEFIAGAYEAAGWTVTLTPHSGDGGRDVIAVKAEKSGFGSVRFLDQCKAYSASNLITHNDVRAMVGVLTTDPNTSKGLITTTSDFEPGILNSPEFKQLMPYRLELKNGTQLPQWLHEIVGDTA